MKKIITAITTASILSFAIVPAVADQAPTIVIVDSGFDTSTISNNVVEEVCITTSSGCNNGTNFEIGDGASETTVTIASKFVSDWGHGTLMAQSAIEANPNVRLILVRNSKVYASGNVLFGGEASLESALAWVRDNSTTYNIIGVSMSRGSNTYVMENSIARKQLTYLEVYTRQLDKMGNNPKFAASIKAFTKKYNDAKATMNSLPDISCSASITLSNLVTELAQNNIASFFATGNDYNTRYVDSPACLDDAVAVTASNASGTVLALANVAPNTDFAVEAPNTSIATAKLAGIWSRVYNGSYNSTYELIASNATNSHSWSALFVH